MTTPGADIRHLLADTAKATLPADWSAYPGPPEVVAFPAAVVVPRSPWIVPSRFCDGEFSASLSLLVPRSSGTEGYDTLDAWCEPVRKAVQALQGVVWEGTDMGPMVAPGGVEAYGASIQLRVMP